jgi:predicted transcriptional regulator of viral defense system
VEVKYAREFRRKFAGIQAFSSRDARIYLKSAGASPEYARVFLHGLMWRGELHPISKGFYTFKEDAQVVGLAFSPYYYGLQDALSIHGLWEQETNPVVITPRKARVGVREFMGRNYVVRRIDGRMFFGFEAVRRGGFWINASDLEKTLLDFAYFRAPLEREVVGEIKKKMDLKKLSGYLKKTPSWVRKRVEKMLKAS